MRKIAIVSEHASPIAQAGGVDSGGQNIYVAQVARRLAAMGVQVDVFTRMDNPYLPTEMEWDEKVRIVHVPAGPARSLPKEALLPYMGEFGDYMARYFNGSQPYDLIHANFFMSAMASLPVARRAGIPLAVTFHALGRVRRQHQATADLFPDARFDIEDDIVRHADRIIAECPQDKTDLIELYQADPRRICMVPCGFDEQEMWPMDKAEARAGLGWDPDAFYMLQLGRMVPRKGVDNVIVALAHLRKHRKVNARLCIVGGETADPMDAASPEMARLRAVAQKEGVQEFVEFAGRRARHLLRKYYCAADAFVTTPWYEPFGITPVEAMACSRPVVGSDTGGIRYTVVDGETGFLVPPREPGLLADKLERLARDSALATRMGAAGLRRARSMFTWDRVARDLAREFDELIEKEQVSLPTRASQETQGLLA
jgi:D-inositol-3-phosphate glycosyltransferase